MTKYDNYDILISTTKVIKQATTIRGVKSLSLKRNSAPMSNGNL
nr:MAG TPA: hypothetical protein [Caudoviricetes sp.]DAX96861.1 MAG TPA: hypothetical protein [Bacteriophage sp.]